MQIGLGYFQVVAKNGIELHLQRTDSGALPLALFDLRKILFAVAAQIAQFVEFFLHATLDHPAVAKRDGWLRDNRFIDPLAHIAKVVYGLMQPTPSFHRETRKQVANGGNPPKRCCERENIARVGSFKGHAAKQPLQIENSVERPPEFLAPDRVFHESFDRIQPLIDFGNLNRGPQQPGAQQTLAHRDDREVDGAEQSDACVSSRE